MSVVTVWPTKFAHGWGGEDEPPQTYPTKPLKEALEHVFDDDAHLVPYHVVGADGKVEKNIPRVNKRGLRVLEAQGRRLLFDTLLIDVDCPEVHKAGGEAPKAWQNAELKRIKACPWTRKAGYYQTRGGYRLVWELPEAVEPHVYLWMLDGFRAELAQHDITADPLKDWGRCYRLPLVVRDGKPERRKMDINGLGPLVWRMQGTPPDKDAAPSKFARGLVIPEATNPEPSTSWFLGMRAARVFKGTNGTTRFLLPEEITENRNVTLTKYAGQLRNRMLSPAEILNCLLAMDEERCKPPIQSEPGGEETLVRIAEQAGGWEAAGCFGCTGRLDVHLEGNSGVEIAKVVQRDLESEVGELVADRGALWYYNNDLGVWAKIEEREVKQLISDMDGTWYQNGQTAAGAPKYARLSIGLRQIEDTWKVLLLWCDRTGFFDRAPVGATFSDVFVRVGARGVVLEKPGPQWRSTCSVPWKWKSGTKPKLWLKLLKAVWRDDTDRAQKIKGFCEFLGVAFLGAATRLQKALVLVGRGANGKSAILKVVAALFDGQQVTAISPQDMAQEYRRARLAGSRLNMISEMPEAEILAGEAVKAMISGDLLEGRHIQQSPFEFRPIAGHIMAGNDLPAVRDITFGFWRRLIVYYFNRVFDIEEQDPLIHVPIIEEELSEVACYCVELGVAALERGHYTIPFSATEAVEEWRATADQVAAWLADRVVIDPKAKLPAMHAYNDYTRWAAMTGHQTMTLTRLGRKLTSAGIVKTRDRTGTYYGVTLKL